LYPGGDAPAAEAFYLLLDRWAVDRVQPDRDGLAAPIMRGQCCRGGLQCRGLLGWRDRVFEVEEYGVGGGRRGIFHVPGAMRRDGQISPGQSRRGHG
jgi:hypothetical protein